MERINWIGGGNKQIADCLTKVGGKGEPHMEIYNKRGERNGLRLVNNYNRSIVSRSRLAGHIKPLIQPHVLI